MHVLLQALELNGEAPTPVEDSTDYVALLKKLIDPNIGDMEMKPTLKLLMEGNYDKLYPVEFIQN